MTRDIKTVNVGDGMTRETITVRSSVATIKDSPDAYADLDKTLRSALDAGLLRNAFSCPNILICTHSGAGWVITATTETAPNDG